MATSLSCEPYHGMRNPNVSTLQNMKAEAVPPEVTKGEILELANMHRLDPDVKLPLHDDIMQLARLGEVAPVRKLFEDGKVKPDFQDDQGITPLHWAAINNHFALCKYLVNCGVNVDARGGDAVATPAMWAAQRCNYYIVNLLLQAGADFLLTDAQGYNILHLATFDGNVFLLILLLHQNIPIDGPDLLGHTCLMWAAYKGYPACVDLFLRWGASVTITDDNGFTALHWALVTGSQACIQKLIEYGSDRFAVTSDGKTISTVAREMKSQFTWERALADSGYDKHGNSTKFPLPHLSFVKHRSFLNKFFFLYPFILIFIALSVFNLMTIYAAVPIALVSLYFLQWIAQQLLQWAPCDMRHIQRTPYLAGVFSGTCFWVGVRWLLKILPNTLRSHPLSNLTFALVYGLCLYFYTLSMTGDPGYAPKAGSRSQQKAVITDLLQLWKFDEENFCTQCMIRSPLRSRHCKRCKRCVVKHDHHCPWVHNCIGANNLRHFVLYILLIELGIILFVRLVLAHLEASPAPDGAHCNILAEQICQLVLRDTFTVVLALWASLQLMWVTMLLFVQVVQISRATTTSESMRGHHTHSSRISGVTTAAVAGGLTSIDERQSGGGTNSVLPGLGIHDHGQREGYFTQWKKLLGFDTFVATAQRGMDGEGFDRQKNPFSRGIITNCKDFWCDPAPYFGTREVGAAFLGGEVVDYARMYETPPRMRIQRTRQGDEDNPYHNTSLGEIV